MRHPKVIRAAVCAALTVPVAATAVVVASSTRADAEATRTKVLARATLTAQAPPPPSARREVRLMWVGDTMLGHATAVAPEGGAPLFAKVAPVLREADIAAGNLEGVLSDGGASKCGAAPGPNCFAFRAPPGTAHALRDAGFDVMSLANNHALDYGEEGQAQTIAALDREAVAWTGTPGRIVVVKRADVRVAFVGFAPYPWASPLLDVPAAQELVRTAARQADVVVALIHAGAEGSGATHTPAGREAAFGEDRGDARAFAHAVIDAGADLVLGAGPHVVRGLERHRGKLIAYSLGNFAGWHNFGGGGVLSQSAILDLTLAADGRVVRGRVRSLQLVPPGIPTPDPSGATAALMGRLSAEDFGADGVRLTGDGRIAPAE